eukprot:jgi/Chrpa1/10160/Chrysochromulina_OHIO_Genome00001566-RA
MAASSSASDGHGSTWECGAPTAADDADGSATTYPDARAALGGNATKMVDLCLTMACDDAMSNLLNMFLYP